MSEIKCDFCDALLYSEKDLSVHFAKAHVTSAPARSKIVDVAQRLETAERELVAAQQREAAKDAKLVVLQSAVDTIPAALMLAGGPPYKLTFTKACLREILQAQDDQADSLSALREKERKAAALEGKESE